MSQKKIPGTPFFVQNIFCIGRNYVEHAKELNNPVPTSPVVFLKPSSSICYDGDNLILPKQSNRVDHEVEIVLVVGKTAKNISPEEALGCVTHMGIGLDFTARDLQDQAKEKGLPWSIAKGFDTFSGISSFVPFENRELSFSLEVNGEIRQEGTTQNMIFPIAHLVSYLSSVFTLSPGDLIFTGTPKGVAGLLEGDRILARLEDKVSLSLGVQKAK